MQQMHRLIAGSAAAFFTLSANAVAPALEPQPYDATIPVADTIDAPPLTIGAFKVDVSGFIKLDALFSIFSDGRVNSLDQGRDQFRPSSVPVTASAIEDPRSSLDLHAKDSRLLIKVDTEVAGHALNGVLEMDYRSLAGGASEVVTNAFTPRLRRAAVNFDQWTLGQEWTTFRNPDAHPENIDDVGGPVEALNIVRQPLLRYTFGALKVALENSETFLLPNGGGTGFVTGDSQLPDLVARYDLKTPYGAYAAAAVARELKADQAANTGTTADGSAFGYGVNLSGKAPTIAGGEVRFSVNYGEGLGRYIGLGTVTDAVVDAGGGLETIGVIGGYVSYRQPWTALWRSNLTLGTLQIDNEIASSGTGVTESVDSGHVNLLYQPVDKLLFGLEYMHAIRELENGDDGTLDRVQFSTKYFF